MSDDYQDIYAGYYPDDFNAPVMAPQFNPNQSALMAYLMSSGLPGIAGMMPQMSSAQQANLVGMNPQAKNIGATGATNYLQDQLDLMYDVRLAGLAGSNAFSPESFAPAVSERVIATPNSDQLYQLSQNEGSIEGWIAAALLAGKTPMQIQAELRQLAEGDQEGLPPEITNVIAQIPKGDVPVTGGEAPLNFNAILERANQLEEGWRADQALVNDVSGEGMTREWVDGQLIERTETPSPAAQAFMDAGLSLPTDTFSPQMLLGQDWAGAEQQLQQLLQQSASDLSGITMESVGNELSSAAREEYEAPRQQARADAQRATEAQQAAMMTELFGVSPNPTTADRIVGVADAAIPGQVTPLVDWMINGGWGGIGDNVQGGVSPDLVVGGGGGGTRPQVRGVGGGGTRPRARGVSGADQPPSPPLGPPSAPGQPNTGYGTAPGAPPSATDFYTGAGGTGAAPGAPSATDFYTLGGTAPSSLEALWPGGTGRGQPPAPWAGTEPRAEQQQAMMRLALAQSGRGQESVGQMVGGYPNDFGTSMTPEQLRDYQNQWLQIGGRILGERTENQRQLEASGRGQEGIADIGIDIRTALQRSGRGQEPTSEMIGPDGPFSAGAWERQHRQQIEDEMWSRRNKKVRERERARSAVYDRDYGRAAAISFLLERSGLRPYDMEIAARNQPMMATGTRSG